MEKESEGVEPDQRRNHEGYQHDRFPANTGGVAAARREFSDRNSTCEGVPYRFTIPRRAATSSRLCGDRHERIPVLRAGYSPAAAAVSACAWAATCANGRPTAARNARST
jgi:hypothetical protein